MTTKTSIETNAPAPSPAPTPAPSPAPAPAAAGTTGTDQVQPQGTTTPAGDKPAEAKKDEPVKVTKSDECTTPLASGFVFSWNWIKSHVKAAYEWTAAKLAAARDWVTSTGVYKTLSQEGKALADWISAKIAAGHGWARENVWGYAWTADQLAAAYNAVMNGLRTTLAYAKAMIAFLADNATAAGLWSLNKADEACMWARDLWTGDTRDTKEQEDGSRIDTITNKDKAVREVNVPAAVLAKAPEWKDYSPSGQEAKLKETVEKVLNDIADGVKKATADIAGVVRDVTAATAMAAAAVVAPAATAAEPQGMTVSQDAIVPAADEVSAGVFFYDTFSSTKLVVDFDPAWGNRTDAYSGLVADQSEIATKSIQQDGEAVDSVLIAGEMAKAFDPEGNGLLVVSTRLGLVVVYEEQFNSFMCNASERLVASGLIASGVKTTLEELQSIVGSEGKPNLGQLAEQVYAALQSGQPQA